MINSLLLTMLIVALVFTLIGIIRDSPGYIGIGLLALVIYDLLMFTK